MSIQVITYSLEDFTSMSMYNDGNVEDFVSDYFICVNATGNKHSIPYFKHSHYNVLNMYFDDVYIDCVKYYGPTDSEYQFNAKACTNEQAKEMFDFISTLPTNIRLHIYCTKGKSRSVAIAKFCDEYLNKTVSTRTGHNGLVYDLLCLNLK